MSPKTILLRYKAFFLAGLVAGSLALAVASGVAPAEAADSFKVIVHPANPAASLSREQLARFFLKKVTAWPSGKGVAPADQVKEAAVRQDFSRSVLHKTVAEVTAYWQQLVFAGRAVPPVEKPDDAAVVAFVTGSEGAIGYVSAGANTGAAKVLKITD